MGDHEFPHSEWRLIDDGAHPVHLGLAIDEMLANSLDSDDNVPTRNTIRFYQFAPPCVVLGARSTGPSGLRKGTLSRASPVSEYAASTETTRWNISAGDTATPSMIW